MARRLGSGFVRYGLPGMVLGIFVSWCCGSKIEPAAAQAQNVYRQGATGAPRAAEPSRGAARGVVSGESGGILALIATPGGIGNPAQWLYLIDTKKRAFAIYRVGDPSNSKGTVKLEAARQFRWDLELDQYNNQGLEPADVKARVDALNLNPATNP